MNTTVENKTMSFVQAMMHYFGKHPGQTTQQFAQELNALAAEDKAWFRANLPSVGYNLTVPAAS